jgi:hypothetical protein
MVYILVSQQVQVNIKEFMHSVIAVLTISTPPRMLSLPVTLRVSTVTVVKTLLPQRLCLNSPPSSHGCFS